VREKEKEANKYQGKKDWVGFPILFISFRSSAKKKSKSSEFHSAECKKITFAFVACELLSFFSKYISLTFP